MSAFSELVKAKKYFLNKYIYIHDKNVQYQYFKCNSVLAS